MGAVAGGLVIFYLIGKVIEWIVWKRIIKSYGLMVWVSSISISALVFVLWFLQQGKAYAFHPAMLINYFMAGIILPILRIFWQKRKEAKTSQ